MASQGPFFPGGVSQTNVGQSGRLAWDNTSAVQADDGIVATCATSPATYRLSYKWVCTNFGFTIPAGQIIAGIELTFEAGTNITLGGQCRDGTAELLLNDVVVGQIASSGSDWTAGVHTRTIGGSSNLWGWTPTVANINDATFGIRLDVQVASGNSASFDWIKLKVYYTPINYAEFAGTGGIGLGGTTTKSQFFFGFGSGNITGGGLGLAGDGGRFHASAGTHGIGLGGTGDFIRRAAFISSRGLGLGGTFGAPFLVAYGGTHGIGLGGEGLFTGSQFHAGTAELGLGGTGGWRFAEGGTGGLGLGGTGVMFRRSAFTGTSGLGVGGTGQFIRRPGIVGTGGIGVGGFGEYVRFQSFPGTGDPRVFRGIGLGGSGNPHGMRAGETINPEDDIPRKHRGQVTRRMVFEAIRRALVDGPLNQYRVYVAEDEPDMNNVPSGQTFAVIIPGGASNDQGDTAGGGEFGTIREDAVEVRVYSTSSIDQYPRATAWNLKIDTGAMERARQVRKTLHLNDLIDDVGYLLLAQPMRATTTGKASFRRATPQWGYYAESFEIIFTEWLG